MRITDADLRQIRARQKAGALPRSRCTETELILFAPGSLENPLNWGAGHKWFKQHRWTKKWHEATANALFQSGWLRHADRRGTAWYASYPKKLTLRGHVRKRFDRSSMTRSSTACGTAYRDVGKRGNIS